MFTVIYITKLTLKNNFSKIKIEDKVKFGGGKNEFTIYIRRNGSTIF